MSCSSRSTTLNDWVGVLGGHPQAKTPNIDALAARGMVFTNAHAVAAICNPSRTALMLGLRPSTTGVYENAPSWLDHEHLADLPTIPRYFRDHGYRTQGAGKIFHAHTYSGGAFAGYQDARAWDAYYPSFERQLPDEVGPHDRPANDNPISTSFDWSHVVTDDRAMGRRAGGGLDLGTPARVCGPAAVHGGGHLSPAPALVRAASLF